MGDLRTLAKAATPGLWHWHQQPDGLTGCGRNWWVESEAEVDVGDARRYADAAYIAAANPAVVLALLDVVDAARVEADETDVPFPRLREALARYEKVSR